MNLIHKLGIVFLNASLEEFPDLLGSPHIEDTDQAFGLTGTLA